MFLCLFGCGWVRGSYFESVLCVFATTALHGVAKCVSAYISENAPVYGDVSVHMLEWAPRRITAICGCLCVRVGGCVRW